MINFEIDGKPVSVPKNGTVMDGANQLGIYIPHFCYHKKLSIAANCRMCLVQVEKAPKPLPACATPAMEGMKVSTHSGQAVTAQKGVMEFLLINHPLDCPICDQGGECQLQDLAVGYGASSSRYTEAKRVVANKNLGPLISTDMTRCIHCTRCVRFGQEIAGIMELGMAGRGEHAEILSFVGRTVDSELSGNMIDLCPVGALVSKPFRYSARTWELSRRKSVSPHCGLGSNLVVQVKQNRVMRVLPRENEDINECWLSDKDRFSYEGLNSEERLSKPMIKREGQWQECDWQTALEFVANGLKAVTEKHGAQSIGALVSPHSTLEELYLLQKFVRGLGSGNIDHRLRQSDFRADDHMQGTPWLGMSIADVSRLKSALVIGSTLRKDHPLLAQRLRQAVKHGAQLNLINPVDDDLLTKVANRTIVAPSDMAAMLAQVLKAAAESKNVEIPGDAKNALNTVNVSDAARSIAASLIDNKPAAIFLGNVAQHHPQYTDIHVLAQHIAQIADAQFGILGEAANSVGAYIAGAVPDRNAMGESAGSQVRSGSLDTSQMFGMRAEATAGESCQAYILLNLEPELDSYDPRQTMKALGAAELVVMMTAYKNYAVLQGDYADVLLPVAPFTETSGTFINTEGRVQSFNGVVAPLGETRPAWKVIRVLGNMLQLDGFDYETPDQVRADILPAGTDVGARLNNNLSGFVVGDLGPKDIEIQRIGEVPIYQADPIVRRAESLQRTSDAGVPKAWMRGDLMDKLGIGAGDNVRLKQGEGEVQLAAARNDKLPANCVRVASAHPLTAALGGMFDEIVVERL
ncbi:NADH-quinone oxidoreductase subunit NuoG [Nitrosovibrio sp. Nv6]|uniref:NADH-quinone oxidoreductase subunit NuoG n=1 Tax=Nitrosovibrio sp. Nv6 TaxID=1855340 RepID=UPI0008B1E7B2|nr:NADH-quinone oxidoreductase subunit NuoG [Nitrosovibrio sp. Nv6]SEO34631.1 NADH-quinone oxidoreductase subunit G [Nitrosovibrio sp. Nv6]